MDASVVVPVRNAESTLASQLQALSEQQSLASWDVIIADNGSSDSSLAIAKSFADRLELRIVDASDKAGAAHARNVGARASAGALLLFCDADDIVDGAWVHSMVDALKESHLVGGRLDFLSEGTASSSGPMAKELKPHLDFLVMAPTANLGMRRSLYLGLGGFDESYPGASAEDVDFCWRAQLSGASFSYCDQAVVNYRNNVALRSQLRRSWSYGQGDALLLKKFAGCGVPDDPLTKISRKLGYGVKHVRQTLRTSESRARWLSQLWYLAGRLRSLPNHVEPYVVTSTPSVG